MAGVNQSPFPLTHVTVRLEQDRWTSSDIPGMF